MIQEHIKTWIDHLSEKHIVLGNFSVCPFAKHAEYSIVETDGSDIDPPPWDFDLLIYVLPNTWTQQELTSLAEEYNKLYPSLIFLPDHKDRSTEINGIQTNNGKYNLLLCQWRDDLNDAREKLAKTDYYSFWNEDYLKEILST
jgi:hypothetical protein